VPAARPRSPAQATAPLRVQRLERKLDELQKLDPSQQAFVEKARKTLSKMAAQEDGLTKADFDALERISDKTGEKMEEGVDRVQAARDSLSKLEDLVTRSESNEGAAGTARQLAESLQKNSEHLKKGGLPQDVLDRLVKRAEEAAQKGDSGPEGDEALKENFSPADVKKLRDAIGEFQDFAVQQLKGQSPPGSPQEGGPGEGAPGATGNTPGAPGGKGAPGGPEGDTDAEGGPGGPGGGQAFSPLRFSNDEAPLQGDFVDETFRAGASPETVTLATGMSRRGEEAVPDAPDSTRTFRSGADAPYEERTVLPRHRAVLEAYFGE
jgi:hypothetical protein